MSNKSVIITILKDLESKYIINWSKSHFSKISKNKLIDCWSQNNISDWEYYSYFDRHGVGIAYRKIFNNVISKDKGNGEPWRNYILRIYDYKYCYECNNLLSIDKFNLNKSRKSGLDNRCKKCASEYHQIHHQKNKDYINSKHRDHYYNNKEYYINKDAKRRAVKLNAIPSWYNKDMDLEIKNIYAEKDKLNKESGIIYHVDHIIPLCGKNVCRLHIPDNLQVITAEQNLQKGNKFCS